LQEKGRKGNNAEYRGEKRLETRKEWNQREWKNGI